MSRYASTRRIHPLRWVFRRPFSVASRGQAIVETTFTTLVGAIIIVVAGEGAVVLGRGMAVHQLAYQGARYAAVNPGYDVATVTNFIKQSVPSALSQGQLSITVTPDTTPRAAGSSVSVSVSFTGSTVARPSTIRFPETITATDTAMTE